MSEWHSEGCHREEQGVCFCAEQRADIAAAIRAATNAHIDPDHGERVEL